MSDSQPRPAMKITSISQAVRSPDRVNVSVDGKYRFSLDIYQLTELDLRSGQELTEEQLANFEQESAFGKLYVRALEYTMLRPHSSREIRDYLWRKTRATKYKHRKTGEIMERPGVTTSIADRVFARLQEKGYVDDEKFAKFWVENRNQKRGSSLRKLQSELQAKGVDRAVVDAVLEGSNRNDDDELAKVIAKKRSKYPDDQKLMSYLARQGFKYDDIKSALDQADD